MVGKSIGARFKSLDFDEPAFDEHFFGMACKDNSAAKLDQAEPRKRFIIRAEFLGALVWSICCVPNGFDGLSAQSVIGGRPSWPKWGEGKVARSHRVGGCLESCDVG